MHIFDVSRRFYGGYAIVGGGLPIATGLALADKMQGRNRLTACFFGEGAVAEGEFYESLNLASLWQLPVLFICENNLYAMGTAVEISQAEPDITAKARVHRMPAETVDGMDVLAVEAAVKRACDAARRGEGPQFVECQTYRFRGHSMADPELYRSKAEVEEWKERDPITLFRERLIDWEMLSDPGAEEIESSVATEINEAIAEAEAGPWEPAEDLTKEVTG
jgi:pyruvate dehydrogenase E1 component alpha subunit/2-oxoisovalerate dehydrogenase E1 component